MSHITRVMFTIVASLFLVPSLVSKLEVGLDHTREYPNYCFVVGFDVGKIFTECSGKVDEGMGLWPASICGTGVDDSGGY